MLELQAVAACSCWLASSSFLTSHSAAFSASLSYARDTGAAYVSSCDWANDAAGQHVRLVVDHNRNYGIHAVIKRVNGLRQSTGAEGDERRGRPAGLAAARRAQLHKIRGAGAAAKAGSGGAPAPRAVLCCRQKELQLLHPRRLESRHSLGSLNLQTREGGVGTGRPTRRQAQ